MIRHDPLAGDLAQKAGPVLLGAICFLFGVFSFPAFGQEEMTAPRPGDQAAELIEKIREGMRKIDDNLLNTGGLDTPERFEENLNLLDELLQDTRSRSRQVIQNLDKLIEGIKYQQSSSGGGNSSNRPKQNQNREQPKPREEMNQEGRRQNPQEAEQQANQQEKPEDGNPQETEGRQRESDTPPPPSDSERIDHPDTSGRWGVLPPKLQNEILNFNIENFPQKYRKWLEEYYRRNSSRSE